MRARSWLVAVIRGTATTVTALILAAAAFGGAQAAPVVIAPPEQDCPSLYVLGVQGTGQSSPETLPTGPDTGMLGAALGPLHAIGEHLTAHAYVPYEAGFGGAVPGGSVPYAESVRGGLERLRSMAAAVLARCPRTELGLAGYSQGAHIVSIFARQIGTGSAAIPADRVAAVALLADPTRGPGAALFPGAPGRTAPAPTPGTTGTDVSGLRVGLLRVADGEGIGPERDITSDFGLLTGRVASLCLPGDLACDAPRMPLLRVLVNIAGQAELNPADPIATLTSIQQAVHTTLTNTVTELVDHDLRGSTLGTLSLTPGWSLSQRLAQASDPRESPDAREAAMKIGTDTVNSLLVLTGRILTTADVAEIAALAPINPPAAMTLLGEKFMTAGHHRVSRTAMFHLMTDIFDALAQLADDSGQLLDTGIWSKYVDAVDQHGAYLSDAFTTSGQPAVGFITDWFTAVAHDLVSHRLPLPIHAASPRLTPTVPPAPLCPVTRPTDPLFQSAPAPIPPTDWTSSDPSTSRMAVHTRELDRDAAWVLVLAGIAAVAYTASGAHTRKHPDPVQQGTPTPTGPSTPTHTQPNLVSVNTPEVIIHRRNT
ncbi:hypothetical protein ABIA39_008691 [Nocardia sp. GAS34]|uniref:cutinase family protein n=1 Tax=unclassified Nocardia TaxID=2637762 RepID=UPI003D215E12